MSDAAAGHDPPIPPIPGLTVRRTEDDGILVVTLEGELDLGTVGELEAAFGGALDDAGARVLLDLAPLAFIDSTGLAAIIRAHRAVTGAGGRLVVTAGPGPVRRTFATTGLDSLLALFEDRSDALRSLSV